MWSPTDLDGEPQITPADPCSGVEVLGDPADVAGRADRDETCNGVDDDCDGLVDEADPDLIDAIELHPDADGDGFGAEGAFLTCDPEAGTEDDTDCDDSDPLVFPGSEEAWGDLVDSDCDGSIDPDPCESAPTGAVVTPDSACETLPEHNWFNPEPGLVVAEVEFEGDPVAARSINSPVVGHLLDDTLDGDHAGPGDVPEIAVVAGTDAPFIAIMRGDGSVPAVALPAVESPLGALFPNAQADLALGDIDGDGSPELVTTYRYQSGPLDGQCYLGAQSPLGATEWVNTDVLFECRHHAPALADLTGDGTVEVIYGNRVFAGADGALLWTGSGGAGVDLSYLNGGYHSFAADLEGDGTLEVIAGGTIYEASGATRCMAAEMNGYPAVADLDGDGFGEIVVTGYDVVRVLEHDCSLTQVWDVLDGGNGGPAALADFDGDGAIEIGVAGLIAYTVYEVDGAVLWSQPSTDISSGSTSSIAFDFEGDGAAEVVYGDESRLWVFDGATGTPRVEHGWRNSGTRNEQPAVADIDGDGSAEIVVTNDQGDPGIYVLEDADGRWADARPVWHQHAFHPSMVADDLTILTPDLASEPGFRVTPALSVQLDTTANPYPAPNLRLAVWGTCEVFEATEQWWAQILNEGAAPAPAHTRLRVEVEEDFLGTDVLWQEEIGAVLEPGEATEVYSAVVIEPWLGTYDRLRIIADPDDVAIECDEEDNTAILPLP